MNRQAKALANAIKDGAIQFNLVAVSDPDGSVYIQMSCTIEDELLVLAQTRSEPVKKTTAAFAGFVASERRGKFVIEAHKNEADGKWYPVRKEYRDGKNAIEIKSAVGYKRKKRALRHFDENPTE